MRPILPLTALLLLGLGALGIYFVMGYLPAERAAAIDRWRRELSVNADVNETVIASWVTGGLAEARTLAAYPSIRDRVTHAGAAAGHGAGHLGEVLDTLAGNQGYLAVIVADAGAREAAKSAGGLRLESCCADAVRESIERGEPLARFARGAGGRPVVAFVAPVRAGGPAEAAVRGAVALVADPERFLYPFLTGQRGPVASMEALLVRREGDEILFLSPLRHDPALPLTLRRPFETPALPARAALAGGEGFGEMTDYRRQAVLAAYRQIESTRWGLVVKVDRTEALGPFEERMRRVAAALGSGLALLLATGLGLLWAQRRAHQAALALSQARFALVLEEADEAILFFDQDGRVRDANRGAEEMYGRPRREFLTLTVKDLRAPAQAEEALRNHEAVIREGRRTFEAEHRRADGAVFPVEVSARRVEVGGETLVLGLVRDITERKRAEQALAASQEELRKLFQAVEQSPVAVMITDTQGRIEYVNPKFLSVTGYSLGEVLGENPRILKAGETPPDTYRELWTTVAAGREWQGEFHNRRKDGTLFWEKASIAPVRGAGGAITHFVAVKEDITERKQAEAVLRETEARFLQAQKMEAVGRLAGGVAHDFNNLLAVILGYAELLRRLLPGEGPARDKLEQVKRAAERAATLTRQLLAFSRKQVMEPKVLTLDSLVAEAEKMLQRVIGEDIELVFVHPPQGLGRVLADPGQIEQVLMNLVVNARDAMPDGGKLTIELDDAELDAAYAAAHPPVRSGRYVMLAVSDNGVGMDRETQSHLFEPFFTTKGPGRGTGLGLATVYGIIQQSGGHVSVYSEPGLGTTFKVYLPRVDAQPEPPAPPPPAGLQGRGETVLVVEDDAQLRVLAVELLEANGYRVLAAGSGDEALRVAQDHPGAIDVLLTDVIMPGLAGRDLARRLAAHRPRTRVLFMSGYTDEAIDRHGVLEPGIRLLRKPFTEASLLRSVREAVEAAGDGV